MTEQINPDIICITETWLEDGIQNANLGLRNYKIFRRDRSLHGGGILIGVRNTLNANLCEASIQHELIFITIKIRNNDLNICLAYRPPNMSPQENSNMLAHLDNNLREKINWLLLGDFNYPNINWINPSSNVAQEDAFIQLLSEHNLEQHVTLPTRGENTLDLLLSAGNFDFHSVQVHETFSTSDHNFITAKISANIPPEPKYKILDYQKTDWSLIHMHLACIDWNNFFYNRTNVNEMWSQLKNLLDHLIEIYVPTKLVQPGKSAPWFNRSLKRKSKKKRLLYSKYKAHPSIRNWSNYNNYCKSFKKDIEKSKSFFEKNKFSSRFSNPKSFFSYIAQNSNSKEKIPTLRGNTVEFVSDAEKAAALSEKFSSVYTVDNGNYPDFPQYIPIDSFTHLAITESDVIDAISRLVNKNSTGADGLCSIFIKKLKSHLTRPLTDIYQCSINTGMVPDDWKKSIVVPVFKQGNPPSLVESYRPIALTSVIVKILEKIIKKHLLIYLELNNILFKNQHGFLSKRSTLTNLIETLNFFTENVDAKSNVDALYIDLSKAFDSVSHTKLIYKLKKYGFGGSFLTWIHNFLTNRPQVVKINSEFSHAYVADSGLPQGSICAPLLFILYIDGISDKIEYANLNLYADDAKFFGVVNNTTDWSKLQKDVEHVNNFFIDWQLNVNPLKSEVIHLGHNNENRPYHIGGTVIPIKNECRDLGSLINKNLSSHNHCASIARKTFWKCKQLSIGLECKDRDFKVFIFKTFIRPLVESNTQVWSPHNICDIDLIEKTQRRFTKFLPGLWNVPYLDRLSILDLDSLEVRRIVFDLLLVYKIIHRLVDLEFDSLFQYNTTNTRGHEWKLAVKYSRLNCRKYFFANRIVNIWNSLDPFIVNADTFNIFKSRVHDVDLTPYCKGSCYR